MKRWLARHWKGLAAVWLAVPIAILVVAMMIPATISFVWTRDRSRVNVLASIYDSNIRSSDCDVEIEDLNHLMTEPSGAMVPLLECLGDPPSEERDSWGRPYQFARRDGKSSGKIEAIGVYSLGEDGISRTEGNDPDDINSWTVDNAAYYRKRHQRMMRLITTGAFVIGLVGAAFPIYLLLNIFGDRLTRPFRDTGGR